MPDIDPDDINGQVHAFMIIFNSSGITSLKILLYMWLTPMFVPRRKHLRKES